MDIYIKASFWIEVALIVITLTLLYLAIYLNHRTKEVDPAPPEILSHLEEIMPKLNQIISMIPVEYNSTLHSSDADKKFDTNVKKEITGTDAEIASILPNRKFDTRELI